MNLFKTFVLAAIIVSVTLQGYSVPARSGLITYTQPDGSTIELRLEGDERFHFLLTPAGIPVAEGEDGYYYLAVNDDEGNLTAGSVRADAASSRTTAADAAAMIARAKEAASFASPVVLKGAAPKGQGIIDTPTAMKLTGYPTIGSPRGLVVLVEYADVKFTVEDPYDRFSRLLSQEGYADEGATGSARDYFIAASAGMFTPQFDLYGPLTLPQNRAYYGGNDRQGNDLHPEEMAIHACQILEAEGVDLSLYDCDNDGTIDNLYIIYAGRGEATGGGASTVWPHSWEVYGGANKTHRFSGKLLNNYACSNELENQFKQVAAIGTFVHEFSHVLGLPDLYCTEYAPGAVTPGTWSNLDRGCYNNFSRTPPTLSAFERMSLGWLTPVIMDRDANILLPPLAEENIAYLAPTDKEGEFFLFEHRALDGWDRYLKAEGMLVWHIDFDYWIWYANAVNNKATHQHVDLVEAVKRTSSVEQDTDPFPGAAMVTEFSASTRPSFCSWSGTPSPYPLSGITLSSEGISFSAGAGIETTIDAPAPPTVTVDPATGDAWCTWESVEEAKGYLVTLRETSDHAHLRAGELSGAPFAPSDDTRYHLGVIKPSTEYALSVRTLGSATVSSPSQTVIFTTPKSGIGDIAADGLEVPCISNSAPGTLIVGASTSPMRVHNLQGHLLAADNGSDTPRSLELPAGIYVVRIGATAVKTAIK